MNADRTPLFDNWAKNYDRSVQGAAGQFPFDGYDTVLDQVVALSAVQTGMKVLDVGTGTGNLAARFAAQGCEVWGIDFSPKMLEKAREKVPAGHFLEVDARGNFPAELPTSFDRIISAYVLHEFDLPNKLNILHQWVGYLAPGGCMVIGDIAFSSKADLEAAHQRWKDRWDEDEFYWSADEAIPALQRAAFDIEYQQVSSCGGVFVITGKKG
jgi:putative AdoMet-dependent methyltransferase